MKHSIFSATLPTISASTLMLRPLKHAEQISRMQQRHMDNVFENLKCRFECEFSPTAGSTFVQAQKQSVIDAQKYLDAKTYPSLAHSITENEAKLIWKRFMAWRKHAMSKGFKPVWYWRFIENGTIELRPNLPPRQRTGIERQRQRHKEGILENLKDRFCTEFRAKPGSTFDQALKQSETDGQKFLQTYVEEVPSTSGIPWKITEDEAKTIWKSFLSWRRNFRVGGADTPYWCKPFIDNRTLTGGYLDPSRSE